MLTSIFYYNHYKPYIVRLSESTPVHSKIAVPFSLYDPFSYEKTATEATTPSFMLNKSLKSDVVEYARGVSNGVLSIKNISNNVVINMENFNKNLHKKDYEAIKEWIREDISWFANNYNKGVNFLSSQSHSPTLNEYANTLKIFISENSDLLLQIGLNVDKNGQISFNETTFKNLNQSSTTAAISEAIAIFQGIYNFSIDVLKEPLSEHMNFKNLNYYYNYKLGTMFSDTFKLIESGMIIDQVV